MVREMLGFLLRVAGLRVPNVFAVEKLFIR